MARCAQKLILYRPRHICRVILCQTLSPNRELKGPRLATGASMPKSNWNQLPICTGHLFSWHVYAGMRTVEFQSCMCSAEMLLHWIVCYPSNECWLHVCHIWDDLQLGWSSLSCLFKQADMTQVFIHTFPAKHRQRYSVHVQSLYCSLGT